MGISKGGASLLYELRRDHEFGGDLLQLGKQSLYVEADQLPMIAQRFGFDFNIDDVIIDNDGEYLEHTYNDVVFFTKLGFNQVSSMDYSSYEGADIIHDLNKPIPESLNEQFDFIYDGGTIEHIFDLPQCLKNIHRLLRVGGTIAHALPSHNHVDHGFYMYSPTLFWDYYHANNYRIIRSYIYEYETEHTAYTAKDWIIYEYEPSAIEHLVRGGWGRKRLGIWFVAQKLKESSCNAVPQQGAYQNTWEGVETYDPYGAETRIPASLRAIKEALRSTPVIGKLLKCLVSAFRTFKNNHLKQSRPPELARY